MKMSPPLRRWTVGAAFVVQGALLYELEGGRSAAPVVFGALALVAVLYRRVSPGFLAASAALGGLGMVVGQALVGGSHHHHGLTEVHAKEALTSGVLMIAGCAAACGFTLPSARGWWPTALHHGAALAGMIAGMVVPGLLGLAQWTPSVGWSHLGMVGAMAVGGWLGLRAASALSTAHAPKVAH